MGISMNEDLDFKSQFYNLQGVHIDERKKNLYKLLRSTSPKVSTDQINVQPRNYLETIFYVDVLIYFRQVDKLIEILKGGNQVLTSKILKERWFFQEAFKNMSEDDIVNNFLPTLSYSLRMKVLKKLSLTLSEERMDKIFDLVLERYGMFIAKHFLFSCSSNKIVNILKDTEIELVPEQLKRLFQKDVNLLKVYFEEFKKHKGHNFNDNNFLKYLVCKQPNLYFELGLDMTSSMNLGCNTARAIIKMNRELVLDNILHFRTNKTTLVKEIKEFDKYLFRFFPDLNDIQSYCIAIDLGSYLLKYPKEKRWGILSRSFKQAYDKEILDHLDKFEEELAKFFPEEVKHKWAEIKYIGSDNLTYIKYYEPKKAFELLKEKIDATDDTTKINQFLIMLVTVCFQNKDYSTYEAVLQYICIKHHSNEESYVIQNMISHIEGHIEYDGLTENHWKYINEMIDILRIRGESVPVDITSEYLLFISLKELPLDGPVRQYVEDCMNRDDKSFRLLPWWKEQEKKILTYIAKILPTLQVENKKFVTYKLISNIVDFNKDLRDDKNLNKNFKTLWIDLNDFAPLVDHIKEISLKETPYDDDDYDVLGRLLLYNSFYSQTPLKVIDEDRIFDILDKITHDGLQQCILKIIKKRRRDNFENRLLEFFFLKNIEGWYFDMQRDAILYFLTKEPEVIAKYFSLILSLEVKYVDNLFDYGILKKYSHLELDKRLTARFVDLVSLNSKCDNKAKLIDALSRVMSTKDFLDLVKDYIPEVKKLDLSNEEQSNLYDVQCTITRACKNLDEPSLLAPVLMHFCQDGYLQASLPALYKILCTINEEKASSYVNVLSGRAVSVRKHAVYLSFEVLPVKDAITIYSRLINEETNISIQIYLFQAVLKHFLKNPSQDLLDNIILNVNIIDESFFGIAQKLVYSTNLITNSNKPVFIEKVWNYLDNFEEDIAVHCRNILLNIINNNELNFILRLSRNLCENIIKKYFLSVYNNELPCMDTIEYFVTHYLRAYLNEQSFEFVFNIIKNYKDTYWESKDNEKKEDIFRFFNKVYAQVYTSDIKFLKLFTSYWLHLFNHQECFFEYISLKLMALYRENPNMECFPKKVDKLFQEVISEYGPYIGDLLIKSIHIFFSNIFMQHETNLILGQFAFHLLQSNSSEFNCLVAFNIINDLASFEKHEIYYNVLDALKAVDICTVKIYRQILLKKIHFKYTD